MNIEDLKPLIRLLADGSYHSGESVGRVLGVSRAAVWKRIQGLEPYGLVVEATKGLGYRLPGGLNLLSEEKILTSLSGRASSACLGRLSVFDEALSTNTFLLDASSSSGDACIAEFQTGGKGRRGRQWVSPYASNLCLSLCWVVDGGVAALEGLSLAVGVVLVEVLQSLGVNGLQLKWPNDLLLGDKKLGGVLIEVGGDFSGECKVVIGVGLNVNMSKSGAALENIGQPWSDLASCGIDIDRSELSAALLSALLGLMSGYSSQGFALYRERWLERAAFLGQEVVLITPSAESRGVFVGVDKTGALQLNLNGCVSSFSGGEISMRRSQ